MNQSTIAGHSAGGLPHTYGAAPPGATGAASPAVAAGALTQDTLMPALSLLDLVATGQSAPVLASSIMTMSPAERMILLMEIRALVGDAELDSMMEQFKNQREFSKALTAEAVKKVEDQFKKYEEEEAKRRAGRVLGWIKAIGTAVAASIAFAAAVYLTVQTGGAAAPLLVASFMALQSAAAGIGAMADPDFKGYMVGELTSSTVAVAEACGAEGDALVAIGITMTVVVAIGLMIVAYNTGPSAVDSAMKVEAAVRMAKNIQLGAQVAGSVTSGAASIGQGVIQMEIGEIQRETGYLRASMERTAAAQAFFQEIMEQVLEVLARSAQAQQQDNQIVSDALADQANACQSVVSAIGGMGVPG
jgi:hypothetical protein